MGEHAERRKLVAALGLALGLAAPTAAEDCRIALALALDVSSSVDTVEYRLQIEGLAAALRDPVVAAAFLAVPGQVVELAVYEWSGRRQQVVVVDWTTIAQASDLLGVALALERWPRAFLRHPTAIGDALLYGAGLLADRAGCAERIIDVSGDGENNDGVAPRVAKQSPTLDGVTVNGLVIGVTRRVLKAHYEMFVIQGPWSFVEMADDHADFSRAMRRKLVRELQPKAVSQAR